MTSDDTIQSKGLIDAADRIAKELIRTPKFKETLIIFLSSIDPPAARGLVRTLFWEDPGLLLSFLGALPALVNTGGEMLAEMAHQMNSMPPPLLQDFLQRVISDIDGATMGEAVGGLASMDMGLDSEDSGLKRSLDSLREQFKTAYRESAGEEAFLTWLKGWMERVDSEARDKESSTYALIQGIGTALKDNPGFVEHVLKPILSPATKTPHKKSPAKSGQAAKPKKAEGK